MAAPSLLPGISRAGEGQNGVAWNVLGHRYFLKAESACCFGFETLDPPGTFVPLHVHPKQDEFIYMLEGVFDLQLGQDRLQARPGDLVRMPMGLPHAYYNNTDRADPRAVLGHPCRPAQGAVRPAARSDRHRRGDADRGSATRSSSCRDPAPERALGPAAELRSGPWIATPFGALVRTAPQLRIARLYTG